MKKITRKDIHLLNEHSSLNELEIEALLNKHVRYSKQEWILSVKYLCILLGIGFLTIGVIFFFAFNWDKLSRFNKLGIIQLTLLCTFAIAFMPKIRLAYKKIIITACALLVGVIFAVFGQVYQTGADAYQFFLAWTICITLWVIVTNFSVLWLVYFILLNTTIILYILQNNIIDEYLIFILISINSFISIFLEILSKKNWLKNGRWLVKVMTSYNFIIITFNLCATVFEFTPIFYYTLILTIILYVLTYNYSIKNKDFFFISMLLFSCLIFSFSVINKIIFITLNLNLFGYLISFPIIIGAITMSITYLIKLQKKWSHEN